MLTDIILSVKNQDQMFFFFLFFCNMYNYKVIIEFGFGHDIMNYQDLSCVICLSLWLWQITNTLIIYNLMLNLIQ